MLKVTRFQLQRYGVAVLSTLVALLLTKLLEAQIQPIPSPLFLAAVTFSAWYGGFGPGMLASILSVTAFDYFFIPPLYTLSITNLSEVVQIFVLGSVATLISCLNAELRRTKQQMQASIADLQRSEERYRRIIETATEGIWLVNAQWRTEYANQRLAEMLGYEVGEMRDRSIFEFMDRQAQIEAERWLKRGNRIVKQPFDFRYRRKDGSELWALVSTSEIANEKGEFVGAIAMLSDITARKQAEEKLWETNHTLSSLIRSCPLGITVFSLDDGKVKLWNPAAEQIFGWSEKEALGRFLPSVPEHKKDEFLSHLEALRQGEIIAGKEIRRQKKDNSPVDLAVWACALRDARGEMSCLSLLADISDLKHLQEELRSALTKLTFHVENSPLGAIEWDENFRVTQWSKQAEKMFGWTASEVLGKYPDEWRFIVSEDWQLVKKAIEQLSGGTEQRNILTNRNYKKNGEAIECEWYNTALVDASGKMVSALSLVQDVTERKKFIGALQESETRFRRLVESNIIGCMFWEAGGNIFDANDAFLRMVGYTREELQAGKLNWKNMTPPEQLILSDRAIAQMQEVGAANVLEKEYVRKDGSRIPILLGGVMFEGSQERGVSFVLDLTERKKAEEALRGSEERLRLALEASRMVAWDWNLDTGEIACSANAEAIWGTAVPTAETVFTLIHPDDRQQVRAMIDGAIATLGEFVVEFRQIRADTGAVQWMEARGRVSCDSPCKIARFAGIFLDVTERKRAEERSRFLAEATSVLAASLDYKTTLSAIADLMVPTLADFCFFDFLTADEQIERVAWKHAERANREWFEAVARFVPPQGFDNHPIRNALSTGKASFIPQVTDDWLQTIAVSGEHLEFLRQLQVHSWITVPSIAQNRKLGALTFGLVAESRRHYTSADLALAEDLAHRAALAIDNASLYREATEARHRAEEAANRTQLLQTITAAFSSSLTPIQVAEVVVNRGIAALGASSGTLALLVDSDATLQIVAAVGYPQKVADEWQSFSVTAPVAMADVARSGEPMFFETVEEAHSHRYLHLAELPANTGNGAFACIPLTVEARAIGAMSLSFAFPRKFSAEERTFLLTLGQQCAQAIARARLYEAEQSARAQAESANRIKDEFLAVLSHELRSPLNPILGWAKLLRTRKFEQAIAERALEVIERNAKLQAQLVEDLLDVSRILRGKLSLNVSQVNLISTIEAAIETVRLAADAKSIQIHTEIESTVEPVAGDPARLLQIVWNLLSNAVKFTPQGGRVQVRLSALKDNGASGDSDRLNSSPHLPIPYAQISVSDTGKGITPEFLPYVFDYFRQADSTTTRVFGGLGLGLAIVRHLVEMHGGTVHAESAGEGKGATFTVRLPLTNVGHFPSKENVLPESFPDLKGLRLVVVDDEDDTRELIVFLLEQYGAKVRGAASSSEALEAIAKEVPDLLLSDIGMPESDGYMLIRQIRSLSPEQGGLLPAIALTAYAGETDHQQILKAGFQKHVTKPVDPAELAAIVANLVGRN